MKILLESRFIEITYHFHTEKIEPLLPRSVWHYRSDDWKGLREYFSAFPVSYGSIHLHTYKKSESNSKPSFTIDYNITRRGEMEAHKNFIRNGTPQTNEADIRTRNKYNRTVNKAEEKFDDHMQSRVLLYPSGSWPFWTPTRQVVNFTS